MTTEILQRRAEIERDIKGRTICDHLRETAENSGGAPALSDQAGDGTGWQTLTWGQTRQQVLELAAGFAALGLAKGERVALMLPNRSEHILADLATVHAGGTPVTFYATLAADQIAYVAGDCDARIAVLDGAAELARWQQILDRLPGLKKIIVRDPAACPAGDQYLTWDAFAALGQERFAADPGAVTARMAAVGPEDPVTLLYTSGTTGNPKGVLLTHHNVLYEVAAAASTGSVATEVRWVSYLPLAHIAERMFSIYLPVATAGHVHFCPQPTELVRLLGVVRPTSFFGVPRVWEKVRAGIQALLTMEQDEGKREAVARAMDTGRRYVQSRQFGHSAPPGLEEEFARADQAVLGPIRSLLGLGEAEVVSSAAAPLPPDVGDFFAGLGMTILDIYGMTETTGAFTSNTPGAFKLGTVGRVFPGMEVRIAGDGEILRARPDHHPRLPQPARADRGPHRRRRLAAHRRHRPPRRRRFPVRGGPQEGADHHRRRGERLARRDREPARGPPAHRAGARVRGHAPLRGGAAHPGRRGRARPGPRRTASRPPRCRSWPPTRWCSPRSGRR